MTSRPTARTPLLDVRGLSDDYGVGQHAVRAVTDANLALYPGEVAGLAGESGSGKSTFAYAITRLLRAPGVITAGSVRLNLAAVLRLHPNCPSLRIADGLHGHAILYGVGGQRSECAPQVFEWRAGAGFGGGAIR